MSWAVAGSHPGIQPQHMQQEEWRACGRAHLWAWASRGLCRSAHRRWPGCTSGGSPRPRPPRPTPTPSPGRKKRSRPPPCPLHEGSMAGGGGQGPKLATVAVRSASAGSQLPMCVAGWLGLPAAVPAPQAAQGTWQRSTACLPACRAGPPPTGHHSRDSDSGLVGSEGMSQRAVPSSLATMPRTPQASGLILQRGHEGGSNTHSWWVSRTCCERLPMRQRMHAAVALDVVKRMCVQSTAVGHAAAHQ
jgi:hypothetical protein